MVKLDEKYIFHIPLFKYADDKLIEIEIVDLIEDLMDQFSQNGHDNLYVTKVKGYYKSRCYDELLITLFVCKSSHPPEEIFQNWFKKHNEILGQEAFAYEYNNRMFIEKII